MIVYKYTNIINGKIYIGITSQPIKHRHRQHLNDVNDGYIFHNAIKKYGIDNFELEIIDTADDYGDLLEKEKLHIKLHNSFVRAINSNGYNQTLGGEGTIGYKHTIQSKLKMRDVVKERYKHTAHPSTGRAVSSETKKMQSDRMKGKYLGELNPFHGEKHSEETRKKISELAVKRYQDGNHPMLGAKLREETKMLISLKLKGRVIGKEQRMAHSEFIRGENHPIAKGVHCATTGESFGYMGEACVKYNLDRSNLTKACKGKTKWCGIHPDTGERLIWVYYCETAQ